ncbi:MAG: hypothetical protein KGK08_03760 [Acidobacteriota bacterium]|nr:hypothetical protein [Acidobacteriota bacterium]
MMRNLLNSKQPVRRSALLCAAVLSLLAADAATGRAQAASAATVDFKAALAAPLALESSSSSSSADASASAAIDRANLLRESALQPPPRRSYGRPRYSDGSHNADGSKKYTFELGGGFTMPVSMTKDALTPNFDLQFGFGRNFSSKLGVIAQFDYDRFGIQTPILNSLLTVYDSLGATDQNGNALTQIGGTSHVWSLTLNPIYNLTQGDKFGTYVVGGFGFYHKTANFYYPGVGTYCDYYYGCYPVQSNQTIDKYTSNAPGFNGGAGFTYKTSRFTDMRFFAEVRYVYVANQARPYYDGTTGTPLSPTYFNVFPQNSQHTTYLPVTFGIRF